MIRGPQVLIPFNRAEALTIAEASAEANRSVRTMREWCLLHDIGRRIGGRWAVSRIALAMLLEGNREALALYHRGDRSSPIIAAYFERCGVPLPRHPNPREGGMMKALISPSGRGFIGSRIAAAGRE